MQMTNSKKDVVYIPIHKLALEMGEDECKIVLALHHLSGADYTSKIGTKYSALSANPCEYLSDFAEGKKMQFKLGIFG